MIRPKTNSPEILFIGINPHPGSFARSVPFSNNKMFWYLLSRAGLIDVPTEDLKDDATLRKFYNEQFNQVYKLGFINIVDRPTRVVSMLEKGEELPGRARIKRIIQKQKPKVVCFVGKVVYEKFTGLKKFDFGWKEDIFGAHAYVTHFPLRGEASVRIRELKLIAKAARSGLTPGR